MKKLFPFALLILPFLAFAQERDQIDYKSLFSHDQVLAVQDSIYLSKLPILEIPDYLRRYMSGLWDQDTRCLD